MWRTGLGKHQAAWIAMAPSAGAAALVAYSLVAPDHQIRPTRLNALRHPVDAVLRSAPEHRPLVVAAVALVSLVLVGSAAAGIRSGPSGEARSVTGPYPKTSFPKTVNVKPSRRWENGGRRL